MNARTPIRDGFPAGLPVRLGGPAAWYGPALMTQGGWIEPLSPAELDELALAAAPHLARVEKNARALNLLASADFPLPTLARRLARMRDELLDGRGFALLRGLPVARWGARLSAVAFYGLGLHIGRPRTQNAQGHLLGHVRDLGLRSDDPTVRIYQTHERQTFHTDSADVVGLLCLQPAKAGGLSALVSSVTIYNELRERRPELACLLFEPLATDRRGEVPPGAAPYFAIPVFNWHANTLSAMYQRQYIDSAQRFAGAPRLTPAHVEALDLFDALADDPALHLTMALEPGDIQFVHNHALLHDRTAFEDFPDPTRRRHLLRLWLAPLEARSLPPVFAQRYGSVVAGARGGIALTGAAGVMPLPEA
ncbi:MAG: TauD/TfdA family dioxygenase [Betaproteobacteria bacterium]